MKGLKKWSTINLIFYVMFLLMTSVPAFASDTQAPILTVNTPAYSNVKPGDIIKVTATDGGGIYDIGYSWNGEPTKQKVANTSNSSYTIDIPVPNLTGTYVLNIYARDNTSSYNDTDWKPYAYKIGSSSDSSDSNAPFLTVSKPAYSNVQPGEKIKVTATDDNGIYDIGYSWNGETTKQVVADTTNPSYSVDITVPNLTGTYVLNIYARDNSASYNDTDWKPYAYKIGSSSSDDDKTAPTLTVSKPSGSTVQAGEKIKVTATDDNGIYDIGYSWNGEPTKQVVADTSDPSYSVDVPVPDLKGTYTLNIYARDNTDSFNFTDWKPYTYIIGTVSNDTDAPTLAVSVPSGSTVKYGDKIKVTATDPSGIYDIGYSWNGEATKQVLATTVGTSFATDIPVPDLKGTYTLNIYARDNTDKFNFTGWKSYTYTIGSTNNDTTPPTLTLNKPSGSTVKVGDKITVTANDTSGIYDIGYSWNGEATKQVVANTTTATYSTDVTVPNLIGTYKLNVYARDNTSSYNDTGWKTYNYTICSGESAGPVITVDPDGGKVDPGEEIKITATDSDDVNFIKYTWDDSYKTEYKSTVYVDAPEDTGSYTLKIIAEDDKGNRTTVNKTFTVGSGSCSDTTPPEVKVSPKSGTLAPNSKVIKITADDDNGISEIGYYWDDDSITKEYDDSVTIKTPREEGKHKLYVYAKDDSPNHNKSVVKSYSYTISKDIEYPGSPDEVNPSVKTLRVELRNADNKIRFQANQDILYYIDYYNGTDSNIKNVEVSIEIPDGFTVTNAYEGTKHSDSVDWSLGTLGASKSGKLQVKMKYTANASTCKEVTLHAYIKKDGVTKDTSTLYNYIYTEGATGYHPRYIAGYTDRTFRPAKGMTRAEFATMLVRVFNIDASSAKYRSNPYRDVSKRHWAYSNIVACTDAGLFGGYGNGRFRPEGVVTRAEFSNVLINKLKLNESSPIWIHANDIEGSWAMNVMEQLNRLNMLEGYNDGSYKPNNKVTRAEAVTLLNRITYRGPLYTSSASFRDVSTSHWASGEIEEAARNHNFKRTSSGDEEMTY